MNRFIRRLSFFAAAALCGPPIFAGPAADWAPNITTTAAWNSNATNANRSSDVIGALALQADLASSARFALGSDDAVFAGAAVSTEVWTRFSGLNRISAGPRVSWQRKFGLGAFAPVFSVELAGDAVGARESARRARAGSVTAILRKRLDDATSLSLSHVRNREDARDTVFDRTAAETSLTVTRDLESGWSLTLAARWREGDVLSYATPPRADLVSLARVRAPNATFDRPMVAYSLDARSLTGSLAANRALTETTSLTFRFEWRETERGPLRYVNRLVSAGIAHQF